MSKRLMVIYGISVIKDVEKVNKDKVSGRLEVGMVSSYCKLMSFDCGDSNVVNGRQIRLAKKVIGEELIKMGKEMVSYNCMDVKDSDTVNFFLNE